MNETVKCVKDKFGCEKFLNWFKTKILSSGMLYLN